MTSSIEENIFDQNLSDTQHPDAFSQFLQLLDQTSGTDDEAMESLIQRFIAYQLKHNLDDFVPSRQLELFSALVAKNANARIFDTVNKDLLKLDTADESFRTEIKQLLENATSTGSVQLPVVEWAIKKRLVTVDVLQYALLIGYCPDENGVKKLKSTADYLITALQKAKQWTESESEWTKALKQWNLTDKDHTISIEPFSRNIDQLTKTFVAPAIRHIDHHINQFKHGEIGYVQLHEILYFKIAELPYIKDDVIKTMRGAKLSQNRLDEIQAIDFEQADPNSVPVVSNEMWQENIKSTNCLRLKPDVRIHVISEQVQFADLIANLEQVSQSDYPYVGIDMESNTHATKPENQVKYLQLAVRCTIYLIKVTPQNSNEFTKLCEFLFANEKLKKIGFGNKQDWKILPASIQSKQKQMRDLQKETGKHKLPAGLSAICLKLFEKSLDKSEQCSLWSREPLRPAQMEYAALDAYCLLMIRDRMDNDGKSCE